MEKYEFIKNAVESKIYPFEGKEIKIIDHKEGCQCAQCYFNLRTDLEVCPTEAMYICNKYCKTFRD